MALANSVTSFGAIGDGIVDDTVAIQACIDHLHGIGGGTAFFPMGTYKVTSAITLYVDIAIVGEGRNTTTIVPATASQDVFSLVFSAIRLANLEFRDFCISCSSGAVGVTGIRCVLGRWVTLVNLAFYGCEQNWYFDRGRFFQIVNCMSAGIAGLPAGGCTFMSTSDSDYIFHANLMNYMINNVGFGVQSPAIYLRRVINSVFTQVHCNDLGPATMVVLENDCQAVKINHSIWGRGAHGVVVQQGGGIAMVPSFSSGVDVDMLSGMDTQVVLDGGAWFQFIGGFMTPEAVAVQLNSFLGPTFANHTVDGQGLPGTVAYQFADGARLAEVIGSTIINCEKAFSFTGSSSNMAVCGNDVTFAGPAIDGAPAGPGNCIADNAGVTGRGIVPVSPPLPPSTVATTNSTGFPIRLTIAGGNFTFVTVNGIAIRTAGNNWSGRLIPGDSIAIIYSVVPRWYWISE